MITLSCQMGWLCPWNMCVGRAQFVSLQQESSFQFQNKKEIWAMTTCRAKLDSSRTCQLGKVFVLLNTCLQNQLTILS